MHAESHTASPGLPPIGSLVETVRGRQQVMDVLDLPDEGTTVFFRPEHGGLEWTVPASGLARVVRLQSA